MRGNREEGLEVVGLLAGGAGARGPRVGRGHGPGGLRRAAVQGPPEGGRGRARVPGLPPPAAPRSTAPAGTAAATAAATTTITAGVPGALPVPPAAVMRE